MRRLIPLLALAAALLLAGCKTAAPSVQGTVRTPLLRYSTPDP